MILNGFESLKQISEKLHKECQEKGLILHNHNSIPCYFDGLEDGCKICIENKKKSKENL